MTEITVHRHAKLGKCHSSFQDKKVKNEKIRTILWTRSLCMEAENVFLWLDQSPRF